MPEMSLAVVILAAGKGTRMKSDLAKVLHPLGDRPLIAHVVHTVQQLHPDHILLIVGHQADQVKARLSGADLSFVLQQEQLGTGHAVQQAEKTLEDFEGDILVLCGDMPLVKPATLKNLIERHRSTGAEGTLLSLKTPEPKDFGRVVRDAEGRVVRIVEAKDATPSEKNIDEYNSGVYCFNKTIIFKALSSIGNDNAQGEYYLTDVIQYLTESGRKVECVATEDASELLGINSIEDLEQANRMYRSRLDSSPNL